MGFEHKVIVFAEIIFWVLWNSCQNRSGLHKISVKLIFGLCKIGAKLLFGLLEIVAKLAFGLCKIVPNYYLGF